jgi:hypothetical protein
MESFVHEVQPHGHLFFLFSGHSIQEPQRKDDPHPEDDGMNEAIVPADGAKNRILDDVRAQSLDMSCLCLQLPVPGPAPHPRRLPPQRLPTLRT